MSILLTQEAKVNGRLQARHLDDLRKSGLTDETIVRCGFHSLQAPASVQNVLRWRRYDGGLGDCLAIPFLNADGKPTGYCRLKPDRPRKSKEDGKPIKYESPKGLSNLPYYPPDTLAALKDASQALIITEGEKKAAKADQEGFRCIGLVGVYGWQTKRAKNADGKPKGERELIPDLAAIPWKGRLVYLCFDSDATENPNVRRAEWHFSESLARQGAKVKIIRLPPGPRDPNGKPGKVGLDDYLVARGSDAFRELLAAAVEPEPPPKGLQPREAPDDPHRLARLFISERCQHTDGLALRCWREEWHRWDGSAYRILPEKELRAELTASAKAEMDRVNLIAQKLTDEDKRPPTVRKITGRMIADVAHALASLTILPATIEPPTWIDGDGPFPASAILACRNGLIHLPSLVAGRDYFHPPTPLFFSTNCLDFDFAAQSPKPAAWLDFLTQLWPDDSESINTLGEWFGYCLTPDTRQQKILMLVGPKRSGKGTVARILRDLVGATNVAGPTLSGLSTNFGLWPLIGKTVAMIQDARLSGRTDAVAITERLLSISGEDALTIDRKNLPPVTTRLTARFMLLTNELPRLTDASGALPGRMILLRLTRSWFGKEEIGLTDRLLTERPGILLWAIAGWQRLRDRGRFVQPDAGKMLVRELADLASPIAAFVRDCCQVGPCFSVERSTLFAAWRTWCEQQGRGYPGEAATFGRNLRAAVPSIGDGQPKGPDGGRYRVYEGIGLREEGPKPQEGDRESSCWNCKRAITSAADHPCPDCGWMQCRECGACKRGCRDR